MVITDACTSPNLCESHEGDMVSIMCFLDPDGGTGKLSIMTPFGAISGDSLTFTRIKSDQAGRYHCRAENHAGVCTPAEVLITVSVEGTGKLIMHSRLLHGKE